jgi:hypothetical protein
MDKLNEMKLLIRASVEMYIRKKKNNETRLALSQRDPEYDEMWLKVVHLRDELKMTEEQTDELFNREYKTLNRGL